MRAITFAAPIPTYLITRLAGRLSEDLLVGRHACTRITEVDRPALPTEHWVRIRTTLGGICGSDLGIVGLEASPSTSPLSSFPFVPGHEAVGVIESVGQNVRGFGPGDRVTVNPLLCCEPRGLAPCAACQAGAHSRCAHFTDGALPPGMFIGTTRGLGGSWGEAFVAHESQLVRVADTVTDVGAVLTEPLACCVHAVRSAMPLTGERILVIGAGTIGLLTIAALGQAAPSARVTSLARHPFQAAEAVKLGAAKTVLARGDYLGELAEAAGTRLLTPILGRPIGVGGFDRVFVCVSAARGVEDAMRFARAGATIVLLGNVSLLGGLDWTPLWLKELTLKGTVAYGAHGHGGASTSAFDEAASLIASGRVAVDHLVTHQLPLSRCRDALRIARAKGRDASVKVVFRHAPS